MLGSDITSEAVRGMHCPTTEVSGSAFQRENAGEVKSNKIPEGFGCVVSGTCQGAGLGLEFGAFFTLLLFFLRISDTAVE